MRLALVLVVLGATAGAAHAYPQFELSTGAARCSLCHISPVGGGLLNDYGRSESADSVSQFGGNGAFLYGAYEEPRWMKFGVDLRGMALFTDQGGRTDSAIFPMLGDTYSLFQLGDFSLYSSVGPRAQVRTAPGESTKLNLGSREYWLMWRKKTTGVYARLGRFMTPFGLRSQDHTWFVRRFQGMYAWEETFNLSAGRVENAWEAHATAFVPVPTSIDGFGPRETGGAVLVEKRLGDDDPSKLVGGQLKVGHASEYTRYTVGGIGKWWLEGQKLMLMGEADLALEDFARKGSPTRVQAVSYLGASWLPWQGAMVTAAYERFDEDLAIKNTWRDATSLTLQYFPLAHWELLFEGKLEYQGSYGRPTETGFFQLHYYL